MSRDDTIKGLERGLQVLAALQAASVSSLHEIHVATAISKPSLLRILKTLEHAGIVSRRLVDGKYRISAFARMERKGDRHDRLAEAAAPILDRLCQKVLWPSDLMVPAGDHMEKRETSQAYTPFVMIAASRRSRVGQPVCWLLTGVGRAYLAFCPDEERERILRRLSQSANPDDALARDRPRLDHILAETRERGYGVRDPIFTGGVYGVPENDGLAAIAVPLRDRLRVHGSINILWIKQAFTTAEFAARHLDDLQEAARDIVESLRESNRRRAKG